MDEKKIFGNRFAPLDINVSRHIDAEGRHYSAHSPHGFDATPPRGRLGSLHICQMKLMPNKVLISLPYFVPLLNLFYPSLRSFLLLGSLSLLSARLTTFPDRYLREKRAGTER